MTETISAMPDWADTPTGSTTPAGHNWLDGAWAQVTGNQWVQLAGLILSVLALIWLARRARKIANSEKPDETLSTLGMLIGLGWSGEAMWIIGTQRLHVPIPLLVLLLFVLEINLSVAMIRAKRHHRTHGHPGNYGTTAWTIAGSMAVIAAFASHSAAEVALRIAIPLLVTKTWWDGMVGAGAKKLAGAITWRWTPRRLLLWAGAIEPGERDVETVHRDRLTQQMTQLEFRRRYGGEKSQKRAAKRLARLSLTADDAIISEVRQRVGRASWFTIIPLATRPLDPAAFAADPHQPSLNGSHPSFAPGEAAANSNGSMAANHGLITPANPNGKRPAKVAANPKPPVHPLANDPNESIRRLARAYAKNPAKTNGELAKLARVSEGTANRYLPQIRSAAVDSADADADEERAQMVLTELPNFEPSQPAFAGVVNGHRPTLEEAS